MSPKKESYINSLFSSQKTTATNYSIRSDAHIITVQKQDKLALNPFHDKRMYLNPTQSLPWNKHNKVDILLEYFVKNLIDCIMMNLQKIKQMKKYFGMFGIGSKLEPSTAFKTDK